MFNHIKTVLIHKYWVFIYAAKMGQPWLGFMHDWSKFHPVEFWESVKYADGKRSPIDNAIDENGYSAAWCHHKGHNPHHYEYWFGHVSQQNSPIQMPYKYAVEMIADYIGAAKAYNGKSFNWSMPYEYHMKISSIEVKTQYMHPNTLTFLTDILYYIHKWQCIPSVETLKNYYYLSTKEEN